MVLFVSLLSYTINTCCKMEDMMPTLDQTRLHLMHRYWNAANYLTVGQIYLQANPLLKEPLRPEHIKPRLLGHWGTSPGQALRICACELRGYARGARLG